MRAETLEFLRAHRSARSELLADRLVEIIERENPGYQTLGVVPRADLWLSCLDNVRRLLELLALLLDADDVVSAVGPISQDPAYDAARATGRRRAEQGQPLDDVLRSFRMGGRMIWEDLIDESDALAADEVRSIGTALWEAVDQTSAQVAVAYHAHVRRTLRADEQLRAELWEGLLTGRAEDPGFAVQAAQALDLPLDAALVVVTALDLEPLDIEQRLAPHASAWVRRTREVVGLVALRDHHPRDLFDLLRQHAEAPPGAGISASGVVSGLAEVAGGYRQAVLARAALGSPQGFVAFDDRLPEMLLLSSQEISERLIDLWLTPLLRLSTSERGGLLDTLTAWVSTGGSATRTAELVPCHRNTVLNRLRRVTQLTGRELVDEAPPVDLVLALRAHHLGMSVHISRV